ncbi:transposase [Streptomyces sp. HSG2]|uniref:transposase n=1 Tax=Streptomyces sp. HSG2 TaxID=2797167 RepID=UPI001F5BD7FD|nr:transposase [Streptomyces sp. HSG2]
MRPQGLPEVPELTAAVAAVVFPDGSLAMRVREELAGVFADEPFAEAFGARGPAGLSPGMLALVTVLQFAENLTDRQAAEAVRERLSWKYALGLELTDTGFDFTVLARFRARLVEHGMERLVFDRLLEHCRGKGLVGAGGKQRTDSTHVISAVRDLNRLELAGESVRAVLEALAGAAPSWLAGRFGAERVAEWELRYAARVDSWRLPSSKTRRDRLAEVYGQDALVLLRAVREPDAPLGCAKWSRWSCCGGSSCRPTTSPATPGDGRWSGSGRPTVTASRPDNCGSPRPTTRMPAGRRRETSCSGAATRSTSPRPATTTTALTVRAALTAPLPPRPAPRT